MWGRLLADWRGDLHAVEVNDPAARSSLEALLCHSALHAIFIHRLAYQLHTRLGLVILSRLLAQLARFLTGVEIHPGARIGQRFFIDHGTGVVIGETSEIGDDCVIFHNVTLGGTGKHRDKRHPSLGDNVLIGTGATLLGPLRVGHNARIGAGAFVCMRDVPADCTVVGAPARIVKREGVRVEEELARTRAPEVAVSEAILGDADRSVARI
ncbi:MAG: serine O-acetyltransferase EpsC [Myxococcota bacterium]